MSAQLQVRRALTEEQCRLVLSSPLSSRALAKELGVSPTTVQKIRNGKAYRALQVGMPKVQPDRRKRKAPVVRYTCDQCRFWRGRCDLDFPEPRRSMAFATYCSVFVLESPNPTR